MIQGGNEDDDRPAFLKTCGRFAAVTPPVMTLLLSTSLTSTAIARSGGQNGATHGDDRGQSFLDNGRTSSAASRSSGSGSPGGGGGPGGGAVGHLLLEGHPTVAADPAERPVAKDLSRREGTPEIRPHMEGSIVQMKKRRAEPQARVRASRHSTFERNPLRTLTTARPAVIAC